MKKLFTLIAITGMVSTAVISCKKDSSTEKNNNSGSSTTLNTFRVKIGASQYQPTNVAKQHSNDYITIGAAEGLGAIMSLKILDTLMPGNYNMSPFGPTSFSFSNDAGQTFYTSESGTLTIVTHDTVQNKISGKYYGRIIRPNPTDTLEVTNGEFNVSY